MLELKKGVYSQNIDPGGEYYRYKYRYNFANSFSRSHILARHLGDRQDTAVELLTLPDLEELDAFENDTAFGDAMVGIKRSCRWKEGTFILCSFSIMYTILAYSTVGIIDNQRVARWRLCCETRRGTLLCSLQVSAQTYYYNVATFCNNC